MVGASAVAGYMSGRLLSPTEGTAAADLPRDALTAPADGEEVSSNRERSYRRTAQYAAL